MWLAYSTAAWLGIIAIAAAAITEGRWVLAAALCLISSPMLLIALREAACFFEDRKPPHFRRYVDGNHCADCSAHVKATEGTWE